MSAEIRWRLTKPVSRPVPPSGPRADPQRNPARVLCAIALASLAAGAINVAAAATVGRGSTQDLAFFSVVASAQLVWGVVTMGQAPRWWLALGAAGNLVVVVIWVVSRTVGPSGRRVRRRHAAGRVSRRSSHGPVGRDRRRRGGADGPR